MRNKNSCSKKKAFKVELSNDWYKLNLASKCLIIIGFISLFVTIGLSTLDQVPNNIGVISRSVLVSVFGFFLSSNIKGDKKTINQYRMNRDCEDEIKKYYFSDGNLIQMLIAFSICIISMLSIIILYGFNISNCIATLSELRDLMCASIGFLLGEANIKK